MKPKKCKPECIICELKTCRGGFIIKGKGIQIDWYCDKHFYSHKPKMEWSEL